MKKFFHNCISVDEADGWYTPIRYTKRQLELYKSRNDNQRIRSAAPSGTCLKMFTDAGELSFSWKVGGIARNWGSFDVYVNDLFVETRPLVNMNRGHYIFHIPGEGMRKVTIYLPHLIELWISDITADGELLPVPDSEHFALFIGDSITQGMEAIKPSNAYPVVLSRLLNTELLIWAVGGDYFDPQVPDSLDRTPDIMTIMLGVNDWSSGKTVAEIKENADEYLINLTNSIHCKNCFGILPIYCGYPYKVQFPLENVREMLRELYPKFGFKVIEGLPLVPHIRQCYNDQLVHPNDEGFLRLAGNLYPEIIMK